jgi:urea-proton symporter
VVQFSPLPFAITWKKQTKAGAFAGALTGLAAGITAWLVEAKVYYGELTVKTTGMEYPTLAGNLAAIMTGLIVTVVVSLIKPDDFDWEIARAINVESALEGVTPNDSKSSSQLTLTDGIAGQEKKTLVDTLELATVRDEERQQSFDVAMEENPTKLRSAFKLACIAAFVLPFIMDFLIPIPMFLSHYIFSEHFFIGWIVNSFLWVFSSAAISVILPLWETAGFFKELVGEVIRDLCGKRGKVASSQTHDQFEYGVKIFIVAQC